MSERRYTVEEANAELPELRDRLAKMQEARQELLGASERIRARVAADGGGVDGRDAFGWARVLREHVIWLADRDILLRDPETGLVDFPAEREGRAVYLCWRLGEDELNWWHELDTGFSGRRPL